MYRIHFRSYRPNPNQSAPKSQRYVVHYSGYGTYAFPTKKVAEKFENAVCRTLTRHLYRETRLFRDLNSHYWSIWGILERPAAHPNSYRREPDPIWRHPRSGRKPANSRSLGNLRMVAWRIENEMEAFARQVNNLKDKDRVHESPAHAFIALLKGVGYLEAIARLLHQVYVNRSETAHIYEMEDLLDDCRNLDHSIRNTGHRVYEPVDREISDQNENLVVR